MNPDRGSFPKATEPETPDQKRARFEAWIIDTHTPTAIDPLYDAVMEQPNHAVRAKPEDMPTRPSIKFSVRARCWECVAGDDDSGGVARIAECGTRTCALWSVRPYKQKDEPLPEPYAGKVEKGDFALIALQRPGQRGPAVRGYCHSCCGGKREVNTTRAVSDCPVSTCSLWLVRPRVSPSPETDCKPAANPGYDALEAPNEGEVVLP